MSATDSAIIKSSALTAEISSLGAELQTLRTSDGRDLQWDGDPAVWKGRAPILFPVIGLLEDGQYRLDGATYRMPKHGFARTSVFETISATSDAVALRLSASPQTRAMYPFEFQLDIDFELADRMLNVNAVISNHGDVPMPASFGFHPALRWPLPFGQPRADHRILYDHDEPAPVRRIDTNGLLKLEPIPTPVVGDTLRLRDELFEDDALIFDQLSSRSVRYGAGTGPQLHVKFADFPTLGVWTKPGADFICIEPWHGFSDPVGFAGDLREKPGSFEVPPGAARSMSMSISLEDGPPAGPP